MFEVIMFFPAVKAPPIHQSLPLNDKAQVLPDVVSIAVNLDSHKTADLALKLFEAPKALEPKH